MGRCVAAFLHAPPTPKPLPLAPLHPRPPLLSQEKKLRAKLARLFEEPGILRCLQRLGATRGASGAYDPAGLFSKDQLREAGNALIKELVRERRKVVELLITEDPVTMEDFKDAGALLAADSPSMGGVYACAGAAEWGPRAIARVHAKIPGHSALWEAAVGELKDGTTRVLYVGKSDEDCLARFEDGHKKGCV